MRPVTTFLAILILLLCRGAHAEKTERKDAASTSKSASEWKPLDRLPLQYFVSGSSLVVRFQFRIEFYEVPLGISFDLDFGNNMLLKVPQDGKEITRNLSTFTPKRVITFQQSFEMLPRIGNAWSGPFLVCTHVIKSRYGPRDTQEQTGHANTIFYEDKAGKYRDFCGALSATGELLYQFPISAPTAAAAHEPVGANENGSVAIAIGRKAKVFNGDDTVALPTHFREILVWDQSQGLKRIILDPPIVRSIDLQRKFYRNEL